MLTRGCLVFVVLFVGANCDETKACEGEEGWLACMEEEQVEIENQLIPFPSPFFPSPFFPSPFPTFPPFPFPTQITFQISQELEDNTETLSQKVSVPESKIISSLVKDKEVASAALADGSAGATFDEATASDGRKEAQFVSTKEAEVGERSHRETGKQTVSTKELLKRKDEVVEEERRRKRSFRNGKSLHE